MTANTKRVVFTMGGKGGVGKTGVMVALAEWLRRIRFLSRCSISTQMRLASCSGPLRPFSLAHPWNVVFKRVVFGSAGA